MGAPELLFHQPITQVDFLLEQISKSHAAGRHLNQVWKGIESGKIEIADYPKGLKSQLKAIRSSCEPVGACTLFEKEITIIFLDLEASLGFTLPFLFHELVHSTDSQLHQLSKKGASTEAEKNKILLEAEYRAFSAQYDFTEELRKSVPEYEHFLRIHQNLPILGKLLSHRELAQLYRL